MKNVNLINSFRLFIKGSNWESICALLLCCGMFSGPLLGQESADVVDAVFRIEVVHEPIYPNSLKNLGVMEGQLRVLIAVDSTGTLRDWLVVEATHRDLGKALDRVIESWRFIPEVINGVAYSSTVYVDVDMRVSGLVLGNPSMLSVMINFFHLDIIDERDRISVYSVRDLDEIPEPIYVEKPIVPAEFFSDTPQNAVFEFLIDTNGNVHVPLLKEREDVEVDERILVITQNALMKWKFEPPTVRGRKVIVKVAQPFDFSNEEKSE